MSTTINAHQSSLLRLPSLNNQQPHGPKLTLNPFTSCKFPINPTNLSNTHSPKPILSTFSNNNSPSMKEQKWVHEGSINESLPNGMFWVKLDNGDVILGYVSGKMRRGSIRILPGDRVKIEVSRYDSTRGRIIYRTRG